MKTVQAVTVIVISDSVVIWIIISAGMLVCVIDNFSSLRIFT